MAYNAVLESDGIMVTLTGINSLSALKKSFFVPLGKIISAEVSPAGRQPISIWRSRIGYSNPLTNARVGRFSEKGMHIFGPYSIFARYENISRPLVVINLIKNEKLSRLILQVDDANELVNEINSRIGKLRVDV